MSEAFSGEDAQTSFFEAEEESAERRPQFDTHFGGKFGQGQAGHFRFRE